MIDQNLTAMMSQLVVELAATSPELVSIMDRAKSGEIDETTAMQWLMETVLGDPKLAARLEELTQVLVAPAKAQPMEAPSALFTPRGGEGMPRLNPLYQAALLERAQFDGDIPELRTGDIGPGVAPAVPVLTDARNPVAIGAMLKKASAQVRKELESRTAERRQLADAVAGGDPSNALSLIEQHGALMTLGADAIVQGTAQSDPAGYRRGEAPQPLAVQRPRGATLLAMSDVERKAMAWQFLSTTQGRTTAIATIRTLIAQHLTKKGFVVEERDYDPKATRVQPLAFKEWSVHMSGPGGTQPAFAVVDVASKSLAIGLAKEFEEGTKPSRMLLEVIAQNMVADRTVGWAARLMPVG